MLLRGAATSLLLAAITLPAATIGKSVPAPPLTRERVAGLPARERAPWLAYLDRSERAMKADRAALYAELEAAGLDHPLAPPGSSGARSIPLNRTAEWYRGPEALRIARIVVSFQTPSGGWSKNLDMADHERRRGEHVAAGNGSRYLAPGDFDTPHDPGWNYVGTLDNDATTTQLRFLARVAAAAPGEAAPFRAAALKGIGYLLAAQYPNGGWPQVWPLQGGYHDAITFNDGAMIGALRALRAVAAGGEGFDFVPRDAREKAERAVARGVDCILAAQVVEGGAKTAWGQQHDPLTLRPVAARNYEPAALSGAESAAIAQFLMQLPDPSPHAIEAVDAAIAWLRRTAVHDRRYVRDAQGAHLQTEPGAPLLWARYYELGSNRPIFGDRDQSIHDNVREISLERQRGYSWFSGGPQAALDAYAAWRRR